MYKKEGRVQKTALQTGALKQGISCPDVQEKSTIVGYSHTEQGVFVSGEPSDVQGPVLELHEGTQNLQTQMFPILEIHMEPHQPHSLASKHHNVIEVGPQDGAPFWGFTEERRFNGFGAHSVRHRLLDDVGDCTPSRLDPHLSERLTSASAMPGKCKFQDSWLSREIYKDWLVKEVQDIHFARCMACCKSIKLQTMGEAALTSHAAGAGHKAAVRKLVEGGNVMLINAAGQINGSVNRTEDSKEQVAICLQRDALDRIPGSDWADQHHSPTTNSTSHNAELQDATFPAAYFTAPASPPNRRRGGEETRRSTQQDPADLSRQEHQQRAEALEQQQQMKILEWQNRMKVLAWEQELVRERRRAARQEEKAFKMKKAYYKAKLKRMGEDVPPSSSSSSDEEEKTSDQTG
ncbi:hypothetical protein F7725_000438 [Dissostichus mawsoni]|uniref:Uncharacterized protein n=1 Tax=Dissostichus mawsoni TaxID=36200 RepID=A0A7J5ZF03_DISMA|nr:hypothetical protein F7725_000438 [Dissostichus mawsoni]